MGRAKHPKSWIAEMRELVGQRRIMIPAAVAWITDDAGRLLVVQLHGADLWGLPGGGIELHETPEQAVVREVLEETGFDVRVDELAGAFGGPQLHHTYVGGDQGAYVMIAYRCTIIGGDGRVDGHEVTAMRYVSPVELDALTIPTWGQVVMRAAFDT